MGRFYISEKIVRRIGYCNSGCGYREGDVVGLASVVRGGALVRERVSV